MLKFTDTSRDRMFYDQYEYGICISLPEAGVLRAKTLTELTTMVGIRNQARYSYSIKDQITGKVLENLLAAFGEIQPVRDLIKLVISFGILYIYSNDVAVLEKLANLPYVSFNSAVRAVVDRPRDIVFKTDPKFKYRSYFKDRALTEVERNRLLNFIESRGESFGVTPYFKTSLRRYVHCYLQRHQFVEHDDPKDVTMLSLVCPGLIRKTVPVQAK